MKTMFAVVLLALFSSSFAVADEVNQAGESSLPVSSSTEANGNPIVVTSPEQEEDSEPDCE